MGHVAHGVLEGASLPLAHLAMHSPEHLHTLSQEHVTCGPNSHMADNHVGPTHRLTEGA